MCCGLHPEQPTVVQVCAFWVQIWVTVSPISSIMEEQERDDCDDLRVGQFWKEFYSVLFETVDISKDVIFINLL